MPQSTVPPHPSSIAPQAPAPHSAAVRRVQQRPLKQTLPVPQVPAHVIWPPHPSLRIPQVPVTSAQVSRVQSHFFVAASHCMFSQSFATAQVLPSAQGGQGPPQSTSDSSPDSRHCSFHWPGGWFRFAHARSRARSRSDGGPSHSRAQSRPRPMTKGIA